MILGNLDEDQQHAVRVDDVHFVQPPRLLRCATGDFDSTAAEFLLGGIDVADLQPHRAARAGPAVAGDLDQRLALVEHRARTVVAGDRQAELVAVELQRRLVVGRPDQHSAGQDLHESVSITPGQPIRRPTPSQYGSRSARLSSLPLGVRGSTAAKSTDLGSLKPASRSRAYAISSSSLGPDPAAGTTIALTASPHFWSGTPITATSPTPGCVISTFSTSAGETFSPPETIMS